MESSQEQPGHGPAQLRALPVVARCSLTVSWGEAAPPPPGHRRRLDRKADGPSQQRNQHMTVGARQLVVGTPQDGGQLLVHAARLVGERLTCQQGGVLHETGAP
jgi:hypothetical protein